jgi:hypothetical protein
MRSDTAVEVRLEFKGRTLVLGTIYEDSKDFDLEELKKRLQSCPRISFIRVLPDEEREDRYQPLKIITLC